MCEIHLIHHAHALLGSGKGDRLSDTGWRQAQHLRDHWRGLGLHFDVIYCGLQHRQRSTADILLSGELAPEGRESACLDAFAHQPVLRAWARRLRHQDRDNMPDDRELLHSDRPMFERFYAQAMEAWVKGRLPRGDGLEPWAAFRERCRAALDEVVKEHQRGARLAVVTSACVIGVLTGRVLGLEDYTAVRLGWTIYNTSLTRLCSGRWDAASLLDFNALPHLEHAQRSELITLR